MPKPPKTNLRDQALAAHRQALADSGPRTAAAVNKAKADLARVLGDLPQTVTVKVADGFVIFGALDGSDLAFSVYRDGTTFLVARQGEEWVRVRDIASLEDLGAAVAQLEAGP